MVISHSYAMYGYTGYASQLRHMVMPRTVTQHAYATYGHVGYAKFGYATWLHRLRHGYAKFSYAT